MRQAMPNKRLEQTGFVTGVPKPAAQAKRYVSKT